MVLNSIIKIFTSSAQIKSTAHACDLGTGRLRADTAKVKGQPGLHSKLLVSLADIVKPCLKQKQEHVVTQVCDPSTQETDA